MVITILLLSLLIIVIAGTIVSFIYKDLTIICLVLALSFIALLLLICLLNNSVLYLERRINNLRKSKSANTPNKSFKKGDTVSLLSNLIINNYKLKKGLCGEVVAYLNNDNYDVLFCVEGENLHFCINKQLLIDYKFLT